MRFSVIIPAHDAEKTLAATLDSVAAQTFTGFEIIVVDDASTDATTDIASSHPLQPRLIKQAHRCGPGQARNSGIAVARGEYITFIDADDIWYPWTLSTLDNAIRSNSDPAFVSGCESGALSRICHVRDEIPEVKTTSYPDYFSTAESPLWIGVGGVAIAREVLATVGGFASWDVNCEDTDLWMRLGRAPGFIRIEAPPLFHYQRTPASLTGRSERIARGYMNLVANENQGAYPGGNAACQSRRIMLTRHTRSGSLRLLAFRNFHEAVNLYIATFSWNLSLMRLKYLLGFWSIFLIRFLIPVNRWTCDQTRDPDC